MKATQQDRPLFGIGLVCTGIAVLSMQDGLLKWLSGTYPALQILFIRTPIVLAVAYAIVRSEGGINNLRTGRPGGHAFRGLCHVTAISFFVTAISELPLATVMAVTMSSPLITLGLSVLVLGDYVGPRRWAACGVGFLGILLMLRPDGAAYNLGGVYAITASVFYSMMVIQTRRLTNTEHTGTLMFYGAIAFLVVGGAHIPVAWTTPSLTDLSVMLFIGGMVSVGQYCLTHAYRFAAPAVLAPFDYSSLLWGLCIGFIFWDEFPDPITLSGAALVVASGLYVLYRESRSKEQV